MNWFKFIFPRFVYTVSILTFYTFAICNTVDLYSYNYIKHLVRQLLVNGMTTPFISCKHVMLNNDIHM